MLSRIAEALFWIGRYVERADDTARILDVHYHLLLEDPWIEEEPACRALLEVMGVGEGVAAPTGRTVNEVLAYDESIPSSIAGAMGNVGQADYAAANAFMGQFAAYRNAQVAAGQRHGRTRSIPVRPGQVRRDGRRPVSARVAHGRQPHRHDACSRDRRSRHLSARCCPCAGTPRARSRRPRIRIRRRPVVKSPDQSPRGRSKRPLGSDAR